MPLFDSLKNAGSSAFDVAKDFSGRLKEDRQQQSQAAQADRIARAAQAAGMGDSSERQEKSFLDKFAEGAKSLGESVAHAAEGTRGSEAFKKAQTNLTAAFEESRESVTEAYNGAKARFDSRNDGTSQPLGPNPYSPGGTANNQAQQGQQAQSQNPEPDIVDGEVVEEDPKA